MEAVLELPKGKLFLRNREVNFDAEEVINCATDLHINNKWSPSFSSQAEVIAAANELYGIYFTTKLI